MVSETKLDTTFPTNQFFIQGYSTVYRMDRNDKGGGIMLFFKDHFSFRSVFFPNGLRGILHRVKSSKEKMFYLLYL